MHITKIELQNFRAFRGFHTINIGKNRKNLLVYGENGAGKSSLYLALKAFLHGQGQSLEPHRNIFANDQEEAYIKLHIAENMHAPKWSDQGNGPGNPRTTLNETDWEKIRDAARTSGFLDYKTLLETYFLTIEAEQVNLFPLLAHSLLRDVPDDENISLGAHWHLLNAKLQQAKRHTSRFIEEYQQHLQAFNVHFAKLLGNIQGEAEQILARFGYKVTLTFKFEGLQLYSKQLQGANVALDVKYFERPIARHHTFLNEAKLSALALAIYFAALRQTSHDRDALNLLVLDDVLIGLDMSNRLPVLDILAEFFQDYQIIFLTYDRTWYEMVKTRLSASQWARIELYCDVEPATEIERPIIKGSLDYLERARSYVTMHDYRGAMMYARTAFETMLKAFCVKRRLNVRYDANNMHTAGDLWSAVQGAKKDQHELGQDKAKKRFIAPELGHDMGFKLRYVLNTYSHANVVNDVKAEVEQVLQALTELQALLDAAPPKQQIQDRREER